MRGAGELSQRELEHRVLCDKLNRLEGKVDALDEKFGAILKALENVSASLHMDLYRRR